MAAVEDLALKSEDTYALSESLPDWPPFPEVPPALQSLRGDGWRLAILSNTDPELLAASINQIGVPIDLLVTAKEAGSYKPAFGHWQRFFELSSADRARYVHVGASAFHDLAAAERLGLPGVWINRLGEQSGVRRAAELSNLSDLPEMLNGLVKS
jgi:2-haloalkanoic acid dehalogenase type II